VSDPGDTPHDQAVDEHEQPLLEHLLELRSRILRSLLFIPFYYYAGELFNWLSRPLVEQLPEGASMIATQVASPFITPFKTALFMAFFVGVPFLLHQLWGFISPGLYRQEKRFAIPLLVSSTLLFYCGMAFAYYAVFPLAFSFFANVSPEGVPMMTDISAFEIPVATLLLAWSGLATAKSMANARPYVIIGCFIVGMLMTPPDVISQLMLAVPTWLLFEIGVQLARFVDSDSREQAN
jgi:sec-independent protein translocase protein TatC